MTPSVDVLLLSYNQEKFIAQAIESALAQQTNFAYRLVIGDDCSPDATQEIISTYAERYPDKIKPLLFQTHAGVLSKDRLITKTLPDCTGKYIALLEGDDYWVSSSKLQKQVDFLEAHPDCAICFHNVVTVYEDGSREPANFCNLDQKEISTLGDLVSGNFIPTCSVMFRNHLFSELPEWYYATELGDWALHLINAQYGDVGYINEVMGAYRIHSGGIWSLMVRERQLLNSIKLLDCLRVQLDAKYLPRIQNTKAWWYAELAEVYYQQADLKGARSALIKSLITKPAGLRQKLRRLGQFSSPTLYNYARRCKRFFSSSAVQ